jgi:hypothetical protein
MILCGKKIKLKSYWVSKEFEQLPSNDENDEVSPAGGRDRRS